MANISAPVCVTQDFVTKRGLFKSTKQLNRVVIKDRQYTYHIPLDNNGHIANIFGSEEKVINGRKMFVPIDWTKANDSDLKWRIQTGTPVISLRSEGKWMHFSFNRLGIYQVSYASIRSSFFDRQILDVAYQSGMTEVSDKIVLIDGIDSLGHQNRQQDVHNLQIQMKKSQIIDALFHANETKVNLVHTLLTAQRE